MSTVTKWIVAACLTVVGLGLLWLASVMAARTDEVEMAEIARGWNLGQFGACNQEMLHLGFCVLLGFVFAAGILAFGIAALLKWRTRELTHKRYADLAYWCIIVPLVGYVVTFSAVSLYDGVRLLKSAEQSAAANGAAPRR